MKAKRSCDQYHFLFTGFSQTERCQLAVKVKHLGGVSSDSKEFLSKCSHIICEQPARTEKFLIGCATGRWLLTVDYIHDSYSDGCWLSELAYEWSDAHAHIVDESRQCLLAAPSRCRQQWHNSQHGVFSQWRAAVLVENTKTNAFFNRLLRCGGAIVKEIKGIRQAGRCKLTHMFTELKYRHLLSEHLAGNVLCLKTDYISDFLLHSSPPNVTDYVIESDTSSTLETSQLSTVSQSSAGNLPVGWIASLVDSTSKVSNVDTATSVQQKPAVNESVLGGSCVKPPHRTAKKTTKNNVIRDTLSSSRRISCRQTATKLYRDVPAAIATQPVACTPCFRKLNNSTSRHSSQNEKDERRTQTDENIKPVSLSVNLITPKVLSDTPDMKPAIIDQRTNAPATLRQLTLCDSSNKVIGSSLKLSMTSPRKRKSSRLLRGQTTLSNFCQVLPRVPTTRTLNTLLDDAKCNPCCVVLTECSQMSVRSDCSNISECFRVSDSHGVAPVPDGFQSTQSSQISNKSECLQVSTPVKSSQLSSCSGGSITPKFSSISSSWSLSPKRKSDCMQENRNEVRCFSEWTPCTPLVKVVNTKMSTEWCVPICDTFEMCIEEEQPFLAVSIARSSASMSRYPPSRIINIILTKLLQMSSSTYLSQTVYNLLHRILMLHPPICLESQQRYLVALAAIAHHPASADINAHWQFIANVISSALETYRDNTSPAATPGGEQLNQYNNMLLLQFLVVVFESNFSAFLSSFNSRGESKLKCSLLGQIVWSNGRVGHMNQNCKLLLHWLVDSLSSQSKHRMVLLKSLQSLVAMTAEHHRLANSSQVNESSAKSLSQPALLFAKELAYTVRAELSSSEDVHLLLSTLRLSWLRVRVSEWLLSLYDDVCTPSHQILNQPLSLDLIVNRFFYKIPPCAVRTCSISAKKTSSRETSIRKGGLSANKENQCARTSSKVNKRNSRGETPLHIACCRNDVIKLRTLLNTPGVDVNAKDNYGWSPLHEAALRGHLNCVTELLMFRPAATINDYFSNTVQRCVDIESQSEDGMTPLHDSVANNHIAVTSLLLKHSGHHVLQLRNKKGETALDLAKSCEMRELLDLPSEVDVSCMSQDFLSSQETVEFVSCRPSESAYKTLLSQHGRVSLQHCHHFLQLLLQLSLSYVNLLTTDWSMVSERAEKCQRVVDCDLLVLQDMHSHVKSLKRHLCRIVTTGHPKGCSIMLMILDLLGSLKTDPF